MRVLVYGTSVDAVGEYLKMSGATIRDSLMNFVDGVISCFGEEYLRNPNKDDLTRLLHVEGQRGFPGSLNDIIELHRSPVFDDKHKLFAQYQESCRKDVERAFGVLQARFAFIRHPCLVWDKDNMRRIMIACIILHNMIVEDEQDAYLHYYDFTKFLNDKPTNRQPESYTKDDAQPFTFSTERIGNLATYMANREAHNSLK
ncbi:uncharacterized protein LOC112506188 [Cynara cardunculus var. scolymus]|uniref:uncharacterized protein LOC112506188 n=1 Tax=Cynara cardunculus var. scolymus TaxID=59895 RepID=UPI000D6310BB|nr:uncharacterized protein LOC112506188 [Cynara cardunculus var. scolymus]